ncbi:MAG: hypothetical protein IJ729_07520, partial [Alloprevotella sp.]|nr:hypothetical protein [Alloprevotella sp.]
FEENVLRFLGRMPYPSHEHGLLYYIPMLLSGLLPWTLLCLLALFGRHRLHLVKGGQAERRPWHARIRTWWQELDGTERFAWLAAVLVIAFYLVPKSKRGVYLLPAYPFLAYFVARTALWLKETKPQVLRWFEWTLAALVLLGTGMYLALQAGWFPTAVESISSNGHPHFSTLDALRTATAPNYLYLAVTIALIACFYALQRLPRAVSGSLYNTLAALILIDAFVLPPVLNARSDKPLAPLIEARAKEMPVYSYIHDDSGMMHFFTLNFYTHNALRPFPSAEESARFHTGRGGSGLPGRGYLLTGEKDAARFREQHPEYTCRLVADLGRRSCDVRQYLQLYELVKKAE